MFVLAVADKGNSLVKSPPLCILWLFSFSDAGSYVAMVAWIEVLLCVVAVFVHLADITQGSSSFTDTGAYY